MMISDDVKVSISQEKITDDAKGDGLKGYLTHTGLPAKDVYQQYRELWVIERAYRVTKGTLEMRPIFYPILSRDLGPGKMPERLRSLL
ncbi:MAG: hypothetical protein LBP50_04610 [Tannerella sp.]|jgi:hypothetical protein|nr:hypothetical protein [Tannerella sp.]